MAGQVVQSAVLATPHSDLISSLSVNHHGTLLATSSLDHTLHLAALSSTGTWTPLTAFTAHSAPVLSTAFAHPEFGTLLASGAADGLVHLWSPAPGAPQSKWTRKAALTDARGSVRALEFAPPECGLKLASVATDGRLRVWECLDLGERDEWALVVDVDVDGSGLSGGSASSMGPAGGDQPSPAAAGVGAPAAPSSATGSLPSQSSSAGASGGSLVEPKRNMNGGTIETDGGWSLSWLPESWWGARIAVSSGSSSLVRLFHLPDHAPPVPFLTLYPSRTSHAQPPTTSLAFAPPSGRSYQLLASASKDLKVRLWKIWPPAEDEDAAAEWRHELDAELDDAGERVGWNVVGTVLSTSGGEDAKVRLWKSTYTGQWRVMAAVKTEEEE